MILQVRAEQIRLRSYSSMAYRIRYKYLCKCGERHSAQEVLMHGKTITSTSFTTQCGDINVIFPEKINGAK